MSLNSQSGSRYRVLLVSSHPVQYAAPLFRLMAQHPKLDILVAYCSLQGAEKGLDPEFGIEVAWDIPLLDGYPWVHVRNCSPRPNLGRFFGLINPGLWRLIRIGRFDAVVNYTGYAYASSWLVIAAAKVNGTALLFGTDATTVRPRIGKPWKAWVKRLLLPLIFRLADVVIVPSTATKQLMLSFGIPEERIVLTPFVVDNDWWLRQAQQVDRAAVRAKWDIPEEAPVALFCAKLQPWKRPQDTLRAFAKADLPNAYLIFAGEGPLRTALEAEAKSLGIADRVRFLGFVNQSQLPAVYRAADLMVLSSEYEPFAVVVNEAMLCGCPVVVSDQVGARYDLVQVGQTGFIYPCGDVDALAAILREVLPDRERLKQMGEAARKRMETWSPRENVEALVQAVEKATALKRGARK
ncbi:Glycosyltransferase involved in cell wall biosynthesis [Candidatus Fervidibacteria bacterium JGI MDM2 JNZ-1-D12]